MSGPPILPGEIGRVETGGGGALVASIADFKGTKCFDIRKFYLRDGAELKPTPKGLTVAIDRLPALAVLVTDALARARADGLLPDEARA